MCVEKAALEPEEAGTLGSPGPRRNTCQQVHQFITSHSGSRVCPKVEPLNQKLRLRSFPSRPVSWFTPFKPNLLSHDSEANFVIHKFICSTALFVVPTVSLERLQPHSTELDQWFDLLLERNALEASPLTGRTGFFQARPPPTSPLLTSGRTKRLGPSEERALPRAAAQCRGYYRAVRAQSGKQSYSSLNNSAVAICRCFSLMAQSSRNPATVQRTRLASLCFPRLVLIHVVLDYPFKKYQFPPLSSHDAGPSLEGKWSRDTVRRDWHSVNVKKGFPWHFRPSLLLWLLLFIQHILEILYTLTYTTDFVYLYISYTL